MSLAAWEHCNITDQLKLPTIFNEDFPLTEQAPSHIPPPEPSSPFLSVSDIHSTDH